MALITCPECGKLFSTFAKACPECAYPLTEKDLIDKDEKTVTEIPAGPTEIVGQDEQSIEHEHNECDNVSTEQEQKNIPLSETGPHETSPNGESETEKPHLEHESQENSVQTEKFDNNRDENRSLECRYCRAILKPSAHFCTKCGKPVVAKPPISDPPNPWWVIFGIDVFGILRKPQTILLSHTILSIVYTIYQIISMINGVNGALDTSDPFAAFGNLLLVGLTSQLVKPHLTLMVVAAVFSLLGVCIKRPWAYLTSAIIQTIGTVILLGILISEPLWFILMIAIIVLGFVAYIKLKKQLSEAKYK